MLTEAEILKKTESDFVEINKKLIGLDLPAFPVEEAITNNPTLAFTPGMVKWSEAVEVKFQQLGNSCNVKACANVTEVHLEVMRIHRNMCMDILTVRTQALMH